MDDWSWEYQFSKKHAFCIIIYTCVGDLDAPCRDFD